MFHLIISSNQQYQNYEKQEMKCIRKIIEKLLQYEQNEKKYEIKTFNNQTQKKEMEFLSKEEIFQMEKMNLSRQ